MKKLEDLENERPAKEFAIITKDGKIVTYYKTSLRYFLNEFKIKEEYIGCMKEMNKMNESIKYKCPLCGSKYAY